MNIPIKKLDALVTSEILEDGPADGPPSVHLCDSALSGYHIMSLSMFISSHGACTGQVESISLFHTDCCVFEKMS